MTARRHPSTAEFAQSVVRACRARQEWASAPCTVQFHQDGTVSVHPEGGPGAAHPVPATAIPAAPGPSSLPDVALLLRDDEVVQALVEASRVAGSLSAVATGGAGSGRTLLLAAAGGTALAARWPHAAWHADGRRRVMVRWGSRHQAEGALQPPPGAWIALDQDRGRALAVEALRPCEPQAMAWRVQPDADDVLRWTDHPAPVRVAQAPSGGHADDAETWVLPVAETARLVAMLGSVSEDWLQSILVAQATAPEGEVLVVREARQGRRRLRVLPWTGRTYAQWPGVHGCMLPTGVRPTPALPARTWASKVGLGGRSSEAVLVDVMDGWLSARTLSAQLAPADQLVRYVTGPSARAVPPPTPDPWALETFRQDGVTARPEEDEEALDEPDLPEPQQAPRRRPREAPEAPPEPPRPRPQQRPAQTERPEPRPVPRAQPQPLDAAVREAEDAAADAPGSSAAWLALAAVRDQQGRLDDAMQALESACWTASRADEPPCMDRLVRLAERAGPPSSVHADVARLAARARGMRTSDLASALGDAQAQLQRAAPFMRTRGRWLAMRALASVGQDELALERHREECLAALAQRGTEERDVPPFVRRRLAEVHCVARDSAGAGPWVMEFLRSLEDFAQGVSPEAQPSFLSDAAWAYADVGMPAKALELASRAEAAAMRPASEQALPSRVAALCRAAAARERASGPGSGVPAVQAALDMTAEAMGRSATDPGREATVRKAMIRWAERVADCPRSDPLDRCVAAMGQMLRQAPSTTGAPVVAKACQAMVQLGMRDVVVAVARRAMSGTAEVRLMFVEEAAAALAIVSDGRLDPPDARAALAVARRMASSVDEFTPQLLTPALAADPDPWAAARALSDEMEKAGHHYAARVVLLAGVRAVVQTQDREQAMRALESTLPATLRWQGNDGGRQRMRIVLRLVAEVPKTGMRQRGLALVQEARRSALEDRDLNVRSEILSKCVVAASQLGVPEEATALLQETVDHVCQLVEKMPGSSAPPHLFETLKHAAESAARIGDPSSGLRVVGRVSALVSSRIRAIDGAAGQQERVDAMRNAFHLFQAAITCGVAFLALGDQDQAHAHVDMALARVDVLPQPNDRVDVTSKAARVVADLPPTARAGLARRILDVLRPVVRDGSSWSRQKAQEVAEQVSGDVVRGESAFLSAMTRWRGDEELRTRARIQGDRLPAAGQDIPGRR